MTAQYFEAGDEADRLGLRVLHLHPEDSRWTDFVEKHPDALAYHHPAWYELLLKVFGYKPAALGCVDGQERLLGILPLLRQRSYVTDVHFSSLPRTPVAGPLAANDESLRALVAAVASLVAKSDARRVELKVIGSGLDGVAHGFGRARRNDTYVLDLPESRDCLRFGSAKNDARIRWAVRRSERMGVSLREASSLADVRQWYRLYLETMRWHVTPPQPLRLFQLMWELLAPLGIFRLLLAERNVGGRTRVLAGSIFLLYGHTALYAFNGRAHSELRYRPNDAIQYKAIMEACAAGFTKYDFGPVSQGNKGLADFKEKWNARPVAIYSYGYPSERQSERKLLGSGNARCAVNGVWRRLPLDVTSMVGTCIDRFL